MLTSLTSLFFVVAFSVIGFCSLVAVLFVLFYRKKISKDRIFVEELLKGVGRINGRIIKDTVTRIIDLENRIDKLEGKAKMMEDDGR